MYDGMWHGSRRKVLDQTHFFSPLGGDHVTQQPLGSNDDDGVNSGGKHAHDGSDDRQHHEVVDIVSRLFAHGPTPLPESMARLQHWLMMLEARDETGISVGQMTMAIQHPRDPKKAPEVALVFGPAEVVSRQKG